METVDILKILEVIKKLEMKHEDSGINEHIDDMKTESNSYSSRLGNIYFYNTVLLIQWSGFPSTDT